VRALSLFVVVCGVGVSAAACGAKRQPADARPPASMGAVGNAAHDIALASDTIVVSRVAAGATLAMILHAQNVAAADIARLVDKTASVFDPRKFRSNQLYRLERALDGSFRRFEYEIDGDRFLRVSRTSPDAVEAAVLRIPKTRSVEHVTGQIDRGSSLVGAIEAADETIDLTLAIAEILGGEIDFSTELQPGDTFDIAVEKQFRDDHAFAGYGPVVAVEFINAGRRVRAVRFAPEGGQPAYYDELGVSMKRFFLASPLKFQPVVTSAFSPRRFHPVLKEYRTHLGVDYRAPAGSPVVAVADGVVLSAGMAGASGRLVHLRHANGFESEYLHLSSISVRKNQHVHQGELIGRVGSSGLATGPHLDYRLRKNGVFINPVTAHRTMPPAEPVSASEMEAFVAARDRAFPRSALALPALPASPAPPVPSAHPTPPTSPARFAPLSRIAATCSLRRPA
jgi:murein DD-endopeptidase MepM/ murein hydrolase activator NlpD